MKENQLPAGPFYISDYWLARPIRMYSDGTFLVSPYHGGSADHRPTPFTNASNINHARQSSPRYVITGFVMTEQNTVKLFGKPSAEYCKLSINGEEVKVLDYSQNTIAEDYFREQAIKSY
jgi:hypothetical protein